MAITKKRMLAAVIAAVFMQAASVYAMNDAQGAEQEEDQKYDAEDQCSVMVSEKVAEARFNRSQLSVEAAVELDKKFWNAVMYYKVDRMRDFLVAGANADAGADGYHGITPLVWTVQSRIGKPAIVALLLEYGANVHAVDSRGLTPLLYALLVKTLMRR